jgi:vacuolar-type H+-ATPase subunit E/Vma4
MGYRELIDSLRKDGEEGTKELWREVKTEAEKFRADTERKVDTLKINYRKSIERAVREQEEEMLLKAHSKARGIMLEAEKTLSTRLFSIALDLLPTLRNENYEEVFSSLVRELPDTEWDEVRVHPQDLQMAEKFFNGSKIIPNDSIRGGMEMMKSMGKICIINTFETRLKRAWEDILPLIFADIYQRISNNESSPKAL